MIKIIRIAFKAWLLLLLLLATSYCNGFLVYRRSKVPVLLSKKQSKMLVKASRNNGGGQRKPNMNGRDGTKRASRRRQPQKQRRWRMPMLKEIDSVQQILDIYRDNSNKMSTRDVSFCWSRIANIVTRDKRERKVLLMESNHEEMQKMLDHTLRLLEKFDPIPLCTTVHGMAKIAMASKWNVDAPVWERLSDQARNIIDEFDARDLPNLAWAFAKVAYKSQRLFDGIANAALSQLHRFTPQGLANTVWAFATIKHPAPLLFDRVADVALSQLDRFKPQGLANTAWAFATAYHSAPSLFDAISKTATPQLDGYNTQDLANTAWAFAVMDHRLSNVFDEPFIDCCNAETDPFTVSELRQLHQFQLWLKEQCNPLQLSSDLAMRCQDVFLDEEPTVSNLQNDVSKTLYELNLEPHEKFITDIGYSVDCVVTYQGERVGIEVDGPRHYIGHSPNGATILKRRQLCNLDGWTLVSVPYWMCDAECAKDRDEKCGRKYRKKYLLSCLENGLITASDWK